MQALAGMAPRAGCRPLSESEDSPMADSSKTVPGKAPALSTDQSPAPLKFDPIIGAEAFASREAALRAMDPATVQTPNCDPSAAAIVALQMAEAIRKPERRARFKLLAAELVAPNIDDELEADAWATWFLESRAQSVSATSSGARVDPELMAAAVELRKRLIGVLLYHFAKNPQMLAEIADIQGGVGYQDAASDLARLGGHYGVHKEKLSVDKVHYDPADEGRALGIANEIISALKGTRVNETFDLRNRAFTRLMQTGAAAKAAADFLFRTSPHDLALFPSLRTAAIAMTNKSKGSSPGAPVLPGETDPAESPGVAPIAPPPVPTQPGMPGGSPLV